MYDTVIDWPELRNYIKQRGRNGTLKAFCDKWTKTFGEYHAVTQLAADLSILEQITEKLYCGKFRDRVVGEGAVHTGGIPSDFLFTGAIIVALDFMDASPDTVVGDRWIDRAGWIRAKTLWGQSWPTEADLPSEGTNVGSGQDSEAGSADPKVGGTVTDGGAE